MDQCGEPSIIRSLKLVWKKEQPLVLVTMVSEQCEDISITMPWNRVVFFEENFLSEKTNENLVGSVDHPISKVCSLFAAVKNAVGLALSSRSGYAGILCLADDLSTTALGIENNRDMTFNVSQFPQMKRGAMNHGIQCWESCGTERLALTVKVTNTSK